MKIALRITCVLLPIIGFVIAFAYAMKKKDDMANELLFFSGLGFFVNIILVVLGFLMAGVLF
ncbi:MAG: hypothetical protein K2X48_07510 [Chitinophagaceae bacterium]|nr:hypothetical protein [Chitinophagaceae bacterium]